MSKASVTIASVSEMSGAPAMKNNSQVIGQVIHRWRLAIARDSIRFNDRLPIENEDEDSRLDCRRGVGDGGNVAGSTGSGGTAFTRGDVGDVDGEGLERGDE